MLKYRGPRLIRAGVIGTVLILLIIAVGLQPERLMAWAAGARYHATFVDAAGLTVGNKVLMSGMKVGSVSGIELRNGKALVTFSITGATPMGSETTAHIRTGTLLGQRVMTLEYAGSHIMHPGDTIPVSRTSSPYSLTEAVSDFTTNTAATNTDDLSRSLDTLSDTLDQIGPQLGPTFDGLSQLSRALNDRNDTLRQLLGSAGRVTGILADRSQQLNELILNANDLIAVLNERRQAIVDLLASVSVVAKQLSALVEDNEHELAPALQKLNSVAAMLENNRDNISKALPGLVKYQITQGEAVASGHNYMAYVPNLSPAQILQPFLDYAFGFRRGTDAGQPPDNAGPRAEIPLPYNGIPGGSR
ncbi:MCE family protein [Mycobacterium sp. 48b]|uniref:MCE family protein n=1 Tax=Mycobacterium sp. 48b TaxID=3400426 RepID=UPI003AACB851